MNGKVRVELRGDEANGKAEMVVTRGCGEREREEVNGKGERELERGDKKRLVLGVKVNRKEKR
jgi:hypothetical protein